MHILRELKDGCMYFMMYIFSVYVDVYMWISKQDIIVALFAANAKLVEPESKEWISNCSLYYTKEYNICITYEDTPFDLMKEYNLFYSKKNKYNKLLSRTNNFEIKEHLFYAKIQDSYISRTYFTGYNPSFHFSSICIENKSDVEFTYVEYTHPKIRHTIELIIPENIWIVGNELFTPAFVLRMLEHQTEKYYFDLNYKIHIVDHNIKDILLPSDKFILIEKDTYSIQPI